MGEIKTTLLTGSLNGYEPMVNCFRDVADGTFKMAGQLIAASICMNGPGPNFFCSWVYDYILHGLQGVMDVEMDNVASTSSLVKFYNKVYICSFISL